MNIQPTNPSNTNSFRRHLPTVLILAALLAAVVGLALWSQARDDAKTDRQTKIITDLFSTDSTTP